VSKNLRLVYANVWQVVDQSSAAPILGDVVGAGLPYDHQNMCKFEGPTSPGYRLVVATLVRYSREAPSVISQRWTDAREMLRRMRENEAAVLLR